MEWSRDTIRAEVIKLLTPHAQSGADVSEKSHLVGDLGIDSLGVMELVADLEDKFKLHIPDDSLREVNTVSDIADAIETRLKKDGRLSE